MSQRWTHPIIDSGPRPQPPLYHRWPHKRFHHHPTALLCSPVAASLPGSAATRSLLAPGPSRSKRAWPPRALHSPRRRRCRRRSLPWQIPCQKPHGCQIHLRPRGSSRVAAVSAPHADIVAGVAVALSPPGSFHAACPASRCLTPAASRAERARQKPPWRPIKLPSKCPWPPRSLRPHQHRR